MYYFLTGFFLLSENNAERGSPEWLTSFTVVMAVILVGLILFLLQSILRDFINHVILKKPAFSKKYKFNQHNLRFAYKVAGCHIIVSDLGKRNDQYMFLVSYLRRRFPNVSPIDLAVLPKIHKFYPEVEPVYEWLNEYLDEAQKIQFIDYLVDLAFYNEKLSSREMKLIYKAGDYLNYSRDEVKSILTMRYKFYEEKQKREREQRQERRKKVRPRRSKKREALRILGLQNEPDSFGTIKKAYRKMAKKHHPDRFHNESKEEKKKANERFAIINEAYEYLEKALS